MTERYLDHLWSCAVLAQKGERCVNCGNPAGGVHHIVKRRYKVLRWDVKNGVPLCSICHPIADRSQQFALDMIPEDEREYIRDMSMYVLQDWLRIHGLTRDEFMRGEAEDLKRVIKGE